MRLRKVLPLLLVIVLVVVGGAVAWEKNHAQRSSAPVVATSEPAPSPSPVSQDESPQATTDLQQAVKDLQSARQHDEGQIADLQRQLSAEQGERKLLSDQVSGLAGRVEGLEKARAEYNPPVHRRRR